MTTLTEDRRYKQKSTKKLEKKAKNDRKTGKRKEVELEM
jgi:hypothetical protein